MRIAMISYHVCPCSAKEESFGGGMGRYILNLACALAKTGWEIDIFTRSQNAALPKIVPISKNARVIHLVAGKERPLKKSELERHLSEFKENFFRFQKEEQRTYDFIYSHYYFSGLIGRDIKKILKIPLLFTFHTLGVMKDLVVQDQMEKEADGRVLAERLIVKAADMIIASSTMEKEYIQCFYLSGEKKIVVIPPGIDWQLFRPLGKKKARVLIGADPNHFILLFTGRIDPVKGIDTLLYGIKIFLKKNHQFKKKLCLWVVGTTQSQEEKRLRKLKKVLQLSSSVRFVKQKPKEKLPVYYSAADIAVMPSRYESFGLSILEALACGTPVLTTDAVGIATFLQNKFYLQIISPDNPIGLARKLEQFLLQTKRKNKNFRQEIKKFSWDNFIGKFKHHILRI